MGIASWKRICSKKDKPGTLLINIYQALHPNEHAVDFNAFLQDNNQSEDLEEGRPNEGRIICSLSPQLQTKFRTNKYVLCCKVIGRLS
jgi:hypothetical protein